jgi:hypothetical protein
MSRQNDQIESVKPELEIDEQIALHHTGWKFQLGGMIFMFTVVLLAAIGMFGNGLLSKVKESSNEIIFEYDRFFRHEAIMEVKIHVDKTENDTQISFPATYLKNFEIESIVPEPFGNTTENGQVNYTFKGSGPCDVTFYLVPQKAGKMDGSVTINEKKFAVNHFIFP